MLPWCTALLRSWCVVYPVCAFADGQLYATTQAVAVNSDQVKERWEEIKQQERAEQAGSEQRVGILADIPLNMPALSCALKIQKRAFSSVGFDWSSLPPVLAEVDEELQEVTPGVASGDQTAISGEELGDLLFATVNVARHLKVNPETALRAANIKFSERLQAVEQQARQQNVAFERLH